jgi:hypothetical protein
MTEQPVEPREREGEQNPAVTTPHPDPEPGSDDKEAEARREALDGSDVGSDTRAGSLQGGSNSGSERDPAQDASDRHLAGLGPSLNQAGRKSAAPKAYPEDGVTNTGHPGDESDAPGDNADAATG